MGFALKSMGGLAKGLLGPAALMEMLAGAGIKLAHQELEPGQRPVAFQNAVTVSLVPGSKVIAMHGEDREGCRIEALIVFAPRPEPVTGG